MNKALSALLAVATIYAPLSSHASDGAINFTGSISATTCTVTNGGATPLSVLLPTIPATALTATAATAGRTSFSLNISGCEAGKTGATAYFDGGPITTTGRLSNTASGSGGPSNVELQLLNGDDSPINLAGNSGNQAVLTASISGGSAVAAFAVRYYHTDATTPAAGAVTSNVTYTMVYQ